jgi:hypothetical protein
MGRPFSTLTTRSLNFSLATPIIIITTVLVPFEFELDTQFTGAISPSRSALIPSVGRGDGSIVTDLEPDVNIKGFIKYRHDSRYRRIHPDH